MNVFTRNVVFLIGILFSSIVLAQKTTVTVGILADKIVPQNIPLLNRLKEEVRGVMGSQTDVVFTDVLENDFEITRVKSNYQLLADRSVDVVLAFGPINAQVISQMQSVARPTIVFGSVNSDLVGDLKAQALNKNNLNYVVVSSSYYNDLNTLETLYEYKNIGIVVDAHLLEVTDLKEKLQTYFATRSSTFRILTLSERNTVDLNGLDAIYLADGGYMSVEARQALIDKINMAELPSFSGHSYEDMENGVLGTLITNQAYDQFFRRLALNIESIASGINASQLPIQLDVQNNLSVNYSTAKRIKMPLRYSMLATTNFIITEGTETSDNAYSVVDIMKRVVGDNLGLASGRKNIELADQDIKTAKSNFLPNINASASGLYVDPKVAEISGGAQPEFSTSAAVGLDQLIYSESAKAGVAIQKELLEAEKQNYNASELDALLNASVAYFNALILKTNTNIQNQNLQLTKRNLDIAEQNFESGEASKADVLRFRSQLAQNTQALIEAGNTLQQSYNNINQLLNDEISKEIDIVNATIEEGVFRNYKYSELKELLDDPKLRPALIAFLVEEAKQNAPELQSLVYNKNVIQRNYDLNDWGRFIPTVSLRGQYNLAISQSGAGSQIPTGVPTAPDGTYNLGLNVSLPIFQQNQRNINRQTNRIQLDQLELQKENLDLTIEQSINDIVLDIISQIANVEISKVSEENAKESLELTQNEYAEGAIPVIQLIDAQNNYLQAQLSSATATYNYLLQSMQLERSIGYFFLMNSETSNQAFMRRANEYILNKN